MIQVSTDYVFDGTAHIPYREEEPTCPATAYGRTKLAGEEAVMRNCPESVVIRTAWLYSTFGNNFVKTMLWLGREKESLGVIFDQIGTPTYARDLAVAIFAVLTQDFVPGIYHFSNEGAISWYDFTKAIHRIAGITTCKVRPLHTEEYPASYLKLVEQLEKFFSQEISIKRAKNGGGKIVIGFTDDRDIEQFIERFAKRS
jgi:dTDP-4-dehydrorhamnose reductase